MVAAKLVNALELKRQYDREPERCVRQLCESLESGALRPENFSIRDLYESICGEEALRALNPRRKSGGIALLEAANAVDTSAFSTITGQIIFNRIKQNYEAPEFIWPYLVETIQTSFLNGERIPGVSQLGDKAEIVDEGMPYPHIGLSEEYIDTAPTSKRGFIVPVTREIIVADRTGLVLKNAGEVGTFLGVNKERRIIDLATGATNNYKRNGTATNTYLTSGAYINQAAIPISGGTEWTAIQSAWLLFDALTDPNTGLPIMIRPTTIIAPTALVWSFKRILGATSVETVDNQVAATTIRTTGPSPIAGLNLTILTSPFVKFQTGSATTWWIGEPKKAFAYMEVWGIETTQAANNSEAEFTQDIVQRFKCSERGVAQVMDPRYMVKATAS